MGGERAAASYHSIASEAQNPFHAFALPLKAHDSALAPSPCVNALAKRAVCITANKCALEVMSANRLKAVIVVQDVRTGVLVAFAASHPSELDATTPVSPLSLSAR